MKQRNIFMTASTGRRFWEGGVIACITSVVMLWSAFALFDLLLAAAKSTP